MTAEAIKEIQVDLIEVGQFNPRKSFDTDHINQLAGSIRRNGQWDPIIVRPKGDGKYELLAGECRLRAIKKLKLSTIKAIILDVDDNEACLLALKTNLMRRDLNPIEEAFGIKKLIDMGYSLDKIAKDLNKSQTWVFLRLKLAENAGKGLQNAIINEEINMLSGIKIAELPEGLQGPVISKTINERLNGKEVEKLVDLLKLAEKDSDIEFLLRTPFKELRSGLNKANLKIQASGKNESIAVIECECGVRYIVDWVNRNMISEKVSVNEH
jgi:ParB/RepB/Spo0J family partition protein